MLFRNRNDDDDDDDEDDVVGCFRSRLFLPKNFIRDNGDSDTLFNTYQTVWFTYTPELSFPWLFPTSREQRQRHNDDDDNDDENDENDEDEDEDEDEKRLAHSGDPFSTSSARVTTTSCG
ncbi:transcription initiation factor TFIID subunit 11-like isoform X1, partial [Vespula squamosa]